MVNLFKKAVATEGKTLLKQGVKAVAQDVAKACGGGLSFTAATTVATAQGAHAIASLHPGDKVWAYNTSTQKMELQPILHVWINHDNDLVDLTITSTTVHGNKGQSTDEVIHTNKKHPFLTQEAGFVAVADLNVGMHVVEADGNVGEITGWQVVSGTLTMYNLEVAQDHTFTVGDGQWVVHNAGPSCLSEGFSYAKKIGKQMLKRGWDDNRIVEAISNPSETFKWHDDRFLPGGGNVNFEPATVFYHQAGGYIVLNDLTRDVVQVSNLADLDWIAKWDPRIP